MKVIRTIVGQIIIEGKTFKQGVEVEVDTNTFAYIKRTFPKMFKFTGEQPKPKPKVERKSKTERK